jgi:hypothetical protein
MRDDDKELDPIERKRWKELEEQLFDDTELLHGIYAALNHHNRGVRARLRQRKAAGRRFMGKYAVGLGVAGAAGMLLSCGVAAIFSAAGSGENDERAKEAALQSPALLRQLGVCSFELEAEARLYDSLAATLTQPALRTSNLSEAKLRHDAARIAPIDFESCRSLGPMTVTVQLPSGESGQVTSTQLTEYNADTWCTQDRGQLSPEYQANRIRVGDEMMAAAGRPCV